MVVHTKITKINAVIRGEDELAKYTAKNTMVANKANLSFIIIKKGAVSSPLSRTELLLDQLAVSFLGTG